jgi:IS5 family transposase
VVFRDEAAHRSGQQDQADPLETAAANVHDAKVLGELLHGDETRVYRDQAYRW